MYKIGDKFVSKYYTDFEVIHSFEHYKGTVIVTCNAKGIYSARNLKAFEEFIKEREYELEKGQVSMGTTL